MRIVFALGGNALLKRSEALSAENQRRNMRSAAPALARACGGHEAAIVHGNGPQVGLLALEADAYRAVPPYPLDMLGAESQGMIGYVIAQELQNACPGRPVVALLTQTLIDIDDPAFDRPTKPIGPVYGEVDAAELSKTIGRFAKAHRHNRTTDHRSPCYLKHRDNLLRRWRNTRPSHVIRRAGWRRSRGRQGFRSGHAGAKA
jgi:carbamate kinase